MLANFETLLALVPGLPLLLRRRFLVTPAQALVEERLRQQPQQSPEMRAYLRVAVASAKDCPVDKAGRTLVPPELREFAGLHKDVVIVGALTKFEIWNRERWNDQYQRARVSFDENGRKLSELGL